MVRTDSKAQKLDVFLQRRPSEAGSQASRHEADMESNTGDTSRGVADTATASSGVPARFVVKSFQFLLTMSHNCTAPLHIACMHSVGYLLIDPCPVLYHTFPVLDVALLQTEPVYVMPAAVHPPHFWSSFCLGISHFHFYRLLHRISFISPPNVPMPEQPGFQCEFSTPKCLLIDDFRGACAVKGNGAVAGHVKR